jgi:hypothetical protein
MSFNKIINYQDYELSNVIEYIETIIYSSLCLFIPMFLSHPQFLVGTIVNCALVLAALNLKFYKTLPIIILPSIGVLISGLLFGSLTKFLIYFIPFLWAANFILVFSVKKISLYKINKFAIVPFAAFFKAIFLFSVAFVMFQVGLVPQLFLGAMGITQFYTALSGGIIAVLIHKSKKYYFN